MQGDAMDSQLLRNAGIDTADAVIVGNAHDADPKDVSMRTAPTSHGQLTHPQGSKACVTQKL